MEILYGRAWSYITQSINTDFVTGNNDADGPFLLQWAQKKFGIHCPVRIKNLRQRLII